MKKVRSRRLPDGFRDGKRSWGRKASHGFCWEICQRYSTRKVTRSKNPLKQRQKQSKNPSICPSSSQVAHQGRFWLEEVLRNKISPVVTSVRAGQTDLDVTYLSQKQTGDSGDCSDSGSSAKAYAPWALACDEDGIVPRTPAGPDEGRDARALTLMIRPGQTSALVRLGKFL